MSLTQKQLALLKRRWIRVEAPCLLALLTILQGGVARGSAVQHAPTWHEQELARFETTLQSDVSSPPAFAALMGAWALRGWLGDDARLRRLFVKVAADSRSHPLMAEYARWYEAALDVRHGLVERAEAHMEALGFPKDFSVLGPFENLGNAGFDEPFAPEERRLIGTPLEQRFDGAEGEIRWRTLKGLGHLGRLDLSGLLVRGEDVVAYVRVAVYSPRTQQVAIRLGSDDAVKLWVNADEVHGFAGRRPGRFDQDAVAARLVKGWNQLLVKLAWRKGGGTLYLRLGAPQGGPADGLRFEAGAERFVSPPPSPGSREASPAPQEAYHPLSAWEKEVAARGGAAQADDWGTLAYLRRRFARSDRAAERDVAAYREALRRAPDNPVFHHGMGRALGSDENARRSAYEQATRYGPFVPALESLVAHYRRRRDAFKAQAWARKLRAVDPRHPLALIVEIERWRRLGASGMARKILGSAISARPAVVDLLRWDARLLRELKQPAAELQALRRYLKEQATDGVAIRRVARLLMQGLGEVEQVIGAYERLLRIWPYSLSDRRRIAALMAENGQEEQALQSYRQIEEEFPEDAGTPEARGKLLLRLNREEKGIAAMQRALQLKPQAKKLREYLAHLRPERDTLEGRYAIPLEQAMKAVPGEVAQQMGAFQPLFVDAVQVHDNGLSSRFVQVVVRIDARAQIDSYRTIPISYIPGQELVEVLLAERHTKTGEVHKPTAVRTRGPFGKSGGMYTNNKSREIEFSDLQPGDTLHLRYRIDEVGRRNMFGDFFGKVSFVQGNVPRSRVLLAVEMPNERPLYFGGRGMPTPRIRRGEASTVYRWEWRDVKPVVREPMMPGYPEVSDFLSVSTYRDWEEMLAWYADLIRDQFELDDEHRALAKKLTEGMSDPRQKVATLHRWVVRNTRYVGIEFGIHGFKPYRASRVIQRGYGDCKDKATLLVSMLAEVGVQANMALVRTIDRGILEPTPATLWAFNHAISYVPSLDLWLDGTHEYSGTREFPHRDQGAMALVVGLDGSGRLVRTPVDKAQANFWQTTGRAEIVGKGDVRLRVEERVRGQGAPRLRRRYQDVSRQQERLEKMLARRHPGARVDLARVESVGALELDPTLHFEATLPGVMRLQGKQGSLPLALFATELTRSLAPGSNRSHDLVLRHPWSEESVMHIRPPRGWSVQQLPDDFRLHSPYGEFELSASMQGGDIVVKSRLAITARRVAADHYARFRAFTMEVDRAEGRRIRLVQDD